MSLPGYRLIRLVDYSFILTLEALSLLFLFRISLSKTPINFPSILESHLFSQYNQIRNIFSGRVIPEIMVAQKSLLLLVPKISGTIANISKYSHRRGT